MNVTQFNGKPCERIRRYFDSYLDNELLVETNHEVLRHLASCPHCTNVLNDRARLKHAIKRTVEQEYAPALLSEAIHNAIRRRPVFFHFGAWRWAMTVAVVAILVAASVNLRIPNIFTPVVTISQDSLQIISTEARELMRVGLVDHVHCALVMENWKRFVSFAHMSQETGEAALGPDFIGLIPLLKEKLGSGFQIVQGHRCIVNNRPYVHVIMTSDKGTILSLIITQKGEESFARANIVATLQASGVPIYRANEGQLEVAAFETTRYLAFIVSNLDRDSNLQASSSLAFPVYQYLRRLGL